MNRKYHTILFLSAFAMLLAACGGRVNRAPTVMPALTIAPTPTWYNVGYRVVAVAVENKSFPVAVWYPTDAPMKEIEYGSGKIKGLAAENAPALNVPLPLLVFSHGYSGGGVGQVALTAGFAARGWIVAAPDHSDDVMTVRIRGGEQGDLTDALNHLRDKPFNRADYAYRPQELRATLDALLASPDFTIDAKRIALAGHSMGGWTVMTVALADARVQAIVLYSIGELNYLSGAKYFEPNELRQLTQPTIYFYGSGEKKLNPRGAYAEFCFDNSPSPTYLVEIPNGNHFTYNDRAIAPRAGGTADQIAHIAATTAAFLDRHVLGTFARVDSTRAK